MLLFVTVLIFNVDFCNFANISEKRAENRERLPTFLLQPEKATNMSGVQRESERKELQRVLLEWWKFFFLSSRDFFVWLTRSLVTSSALLGCEICLPSLP